MALTIEQQERAARLAKDMAPMIAKSRFFGCESVDQAFVIADYAILIGRPVITLAHEINVFDGKISVPASQMLRSLREAGGDYEVLKRDAEEASIMVTYRGKSLTMSITWEQAQQERYPYTRDGKVKPNWATPLSRTQMLWARVASEAVRTMAPEVLGPRYTPEEIGSPEPDDVVTEVEDDGQVVEESTPAATEHSTTLADSDTPTMSTPEQRGIIKDMFHLLGATSEQIDAALAKRGVQTLIQLTSEQAEEIIDKLKSKISEADKADTTTQESDAACDEVLASEIRSALREMDPEQSKKVINFMKGCGVPKLRYMRRDDALTLLAACQKQNLESFFDRQLQPIVGGDEDDPFQDGAEKD